MADDGQSCGVADGAGLQGGVDDHGGVQQSGAPHIVCSSGHTPLVSDDHTDSSGHTPLVSDDHTDSSGHTPLVTDTTQTAVDTHL